MVVYSGSATCIPMGPLIIILCYCSSACRAAIKRGRFLSSSQLLKYQVLATLSNHSASKSKQAIMVSSGVLLLLAVCTATVSAQTDCASQNDFLGMLDQVIETKVNNTLFRDSLDVLVNRISERIEGEINMTLNSELERRVRDQIGNVLATEPGE